MSSNSPSWLVQWLWSWTHGAEGRIQMLEHHTRTATEERRALARRLRWIERGAQAVATIGLTLLATLAPERAQTLAKVLSSLLRGP